MAGEIRRIAVVIASGASTSTSVELRGSAIVGWEMPDAWTTAALTEQHSVTGSTWQDVYDDGGTEKSSSAAAGKKVELAPSAYKGLSAVLFRFRSGTSATPVAQGADRTITLLVRELA